MFRKIANIELMKNIKSPAFYIFGLIFLLPILIFTLTTDTGSYLMGIAHGKEHFNAPIIIAQFITRFSVFGGLFTMMIIGRTVAKDFEAGIHEIVFSYPLSKFNYLFGRFTGGFIANLLLFIGLFLGFEIGFMLIDPKLVGSFRAGAYLWPLLLTFIPNTLIIGSIFFRLATISRNMVSTYIAGIAFLGVYGIAAAGFGYIQNDSLKILLDPFGINGLNVLSRYWTVADMNQSFMPINGMVILNRIIWTGIAILILWSTYRKFKFVAVLEGKKEKSTKIVEESASTEEVLKPSLRLNHSKLFQFKHCYMQSLKPTKRILFLLS